MTWCIVNIYTNIDTERVLGSQQGMEFAQIFISYINLAFDKALA